MQRIVERQVRGVAKRPRDPIAGADPFMRPPDPVGGAHRSGVRGEKHGIKDAAVAAASAQITDEGFLDFSARGLRFCGQQRASGHDHSRDAEATLNRTGRDEGLLKRIQPSLRRQPLDRGDLLAVHFDAQAPGTSTQPGR